MQIVSADSASHDIKVIGTYQRAETDIAEQARDEYVSGSVSDESETYNMFGIVGSPELTELLIEADTALDNYKKIFGGSEAASTSAETSTETAESAAAATSENADEEEEPVDPTDNGLIENKSENGIVIYTSDGDDKIKIDKYISGITINAGDGDDEIEILAGDNITLNMGDGDDKVILRDGVRDALVNLGNGDDSLYMYGAQQVRAYGGMGDDKMQVKGGTNIKLNGGFGNDVIDIFNVTNLIIDAGEGDDAITMGDGQYGNVQGGEGGDVIIGAGNFEAGEGSDYIRIKEAFYTGTKTKVQSTVTYNAGDGNDTISGADENTTIDMVNISSNDVEITEKKGAGGKSEMVIKMKDGSGSITINNATGSGAKLKLSDDEIIL